MDDCAGDYHAVCARATASSATSGSPYGIMAGAADFIAPRPLAVTVGNYLLMYADGRFARHPRFCYFTRHPHFCYFALNTGMCWRALQAGRIYVRQHPRDAQLFFFDCVNTVVIHQYYHCSALRRNVYIGMFAQARPPPMPCIRLVRVFPD